MLPLLLGAPAVVAATTDLTTYAIGVGLFGAGGLFGYFLQPTPPAPNEYKDSSAREYSYLNQAEALQDKTRRVRRQVLENLGEEAIGALERVLEEAHKSRLKFGSLSADFAARAEEMKKTNQILLGLIKTLEKGNETAAETIANLSSELEGLKKTLTETRKKFGKTMSRFLKRTRDLEKIIENFNHLKSELETTQLEYREQIIILTSALEQANTRFNSQLADHAHQDEHLKALQTKVEQLTTCLQMATEKGEAYAKELSRIKLKNQSQAEEIKALRVCKEGEPEVHAEHRMNRFF